MKDFDNQPLPFFAAIMSSIFGNEEEQAAAQEWLDNSHLKPTE